VLNGQVSRTWIWGPEANTDVISEPYAEFPGGTRQVQYYDKSRMEINNPDGDPENLFYVTNGLLVVELMTGNLQKGDNTFEHHNPAIVNVAGDSDDPTGPTYATMALLRDLPPLDDNAVITQRVDRAGTVTDDPSLAAQQVTAAYHVVVPGLDHQIAEPFWSFMNSSGLVKADGQYVNQALFTNPFYATGYPITEAYWASVKVANTYRLVLMQCFERRCLTYTGVASDAMGNIYVVDSGNARIQKFSADGNYLDQWGSFGTGDGQLSDPLGIRVTVDRVYVVDTSNNRIEVFDLNGNYLGQFGGAGSGDGQLSAPWRITTDSAGYVYVTDTNNNRVQVFAPVP